MFTITATDGLARCGTFFTRHAQLSTPAPLIYTRRGGALYLTPDLLSRLRDRAAAAASADGQGSVGAVAAAAAAAAAAAPRASSSSISSSSSSGPTMMLGLVTTQFLDQPSPELLAAVAGASAASSGGGGGGGNNNAGAAWAGLHGWPALALNRDPLALEYGPAAGARPATNSGPHVAVASGHALADVRAWMAAVRAMSPDCFVGLADELPCGGGRGGREGVDGSLAAAAAAAAAAAIAPATPGPGVEAASSYEDLVRAVDAAEEEEEGRRDHAARQAREKGAGGAGRPPGGGGKAASGGGGKAGPRLAFPAGVDARVARAVERTAWWADRCLAELEEVGEGGEGAAASDDDVAAGRAEQDRGLPVPFERRGGAREEEDEEAPGAAAAAAAAAADPPRPPPPPPLQFFAPVVGCDSPAARLVSAREAARRDGPRVAGYALCGFGTGEPAAARAALLRAALGPLPRHKPRLLSALLDNGPLEVLDAVAMGVDLFDCSWPTASTAAGYALSFPITPAEAETPGMYDDDGEEDAIGGADGAPAAATPEEAPWAAAAPAPVTSAEAAAAAAAAEAAGGPTRGRRLPDGARLNLWAPGFRLDRRPLLARGCSCQACAPPAPAAEAAANDRPPLPPPSRAYVHHLLAVEEMVAQVLLDAHNEHHWLRFFAQVRREVAAGTLAGYRAWLGAQLDRATWPAAPG